LNGNTVKAKVVWSICKGLLLAVLGAAGLLASINGYSAVYADSTAGTDNATVLQNAQPAVDAGIPLTPDQKSQWSELHRRAPFAIRDALVDRRLAGRTVGTSISVLPNIQYTPSQRNQGGCGDCWVWAGTGVLEAALDAQLGIKDRLSIQYFDSNYNNGAAGSFACCGGTVPYFVDFYASTLKKAIPWSNTNAAFADGSRSCYNGAAVSASSIATSPSYTINSISDQQIQTTGVSDATAVANIKNILNQNQAVVFAFYMTTSDWSTFQSWWNSSSNTSIWPNGFSCGAPHSSSWDGHAVTCVGYNDDSSDPNQQYWIMLNSWGTTSGRPDGTFRIPMHNTFSCADSIGSYNTEWWTIPVTFSSSGPAPSPFPAPVLTSPADNTTVGGSSITFQWNASSGASNYWLSIWRSSDKAYIVNQAVGNITSVAVNGFPNNGIQYTWSVAGGNGTTWGPGAAVRTFTSGSVPTPPSAPVLTWPAAGATVSGASITFQWNASTGATAYYLTVVKASDNSTFYSKPLGNVTSQSVSGFPNNGTQYSWNVVASNSAGQGPAAAFQSFTNALYPAPALISPAAGATVSGASVTFQWNAVSLATAYWLSVWRSSDKAYIINQAVGNVTSMVVNGFPNNGTQYTWSVAGGGSAGWGASAVSRTFTSGAGVTPPIAPVLNSPTAGATVSGTSVTFQWNASAGATAYYLTVVKASDNSTFYGQQVGNVTSQIVSGFPNNNTQYRWTVAGSNSAGTGPAAAFQSFTNGSAVTPPPAPVLTSPAAGASITGTGITFQWNAAAGATNYLLTVVKASDNSTFYSQQVGNVTSQIVNGFPNNNTQYRWNVIASNSAGQGPAAAFQSFTNAMTPPPAPVLTSPAAGASITGTGITFQWNAAAGATNYLLTVVKASDNSTFYSQQVGNVISQSVSGFPNNNTQYSWNVIASNSAGQGPAAAFQSFTNGSAVPPPPAPMLTSPAAGATTHGAYVTFQWNPSSGATTYWLSVWRTSDKAYIFNQNVGKVFSVMVVGFPANGTQYSWSVAGANSAGWGSAAPISTFTSSP
jgi:hypothetical protein